MRKGENERVRDGERELGEREFENNQNRETNGKLEDEIYLGYSEDKFVLSISKKSPRYFQDGTVPIKW